MRRCKEMCGPVCRAGTIRGPTRTDIGASRCLLNGDGDTRVLCRNIQCGISDF
jgi:hypothetical protein